MFNVCWDERSDLIARLCIFQKQLQDFSIAIGQQLPVSVLQETTKQLYQIFIAAEQVAKSQQNIGWIDSNINSNYIFYREWNTFDTVILKFFTNRTQLPKGPPKCTQAFQGETSELKGSLEFNFLCCEVEVWWFCNDDVIKIQKNSQPVHRYRKYTNLRFCVGNFATAHLSSHSFHDH